MHSVTYKKADDLMQIMGIQDDDYLALCIFVLLDAESCFCHCFLYHTNRIWTLIGWIDTFLGDKCGNFFPEGCKIVVSFLLSYLHFTFLKDLKAEN